MDELQDQLRRVETLIGGLDGQFDPVARDRIQEIVGLILDMHGEGLRRLLDRLESGLINDLARDPVLGALLLLHGLHPQDLDTRVRAALDQVRPQLASHGGNVELVGIDENGVLRLRLEGSCHGCPSSAATLRSTIETAIQAAAPDVSAIVLEEPAPAGREVAP